MPQVSVIVPSFNHGQFLSACLESVRAQTFKDWEVIVVDDRSLDDSVQRARTFAGLDPRVRVFVNERNVGTYATQNAALERATGEYVAVLNSDDFWHHQKLERQLALMVGNPDLPLCYVLGWKCDSSGTLDEAFDVHADWPRDEVQDLLPRLLEENRVLASGVLFRRERLRFDPNLRYSGDWVALLRLAAESRVGCVADRLTYWRVHGANSHLVSTGQVVEEIRVRRAILRARSDWKGQWRDNSSVRSGLARCAYYLLALYVFIGDMRGARRTGVEVLKLKIDRTMLKRVASSYLPGRWVRRHLWADSGADLGPNDLRVVRDDLLALGDLDLGLS